MHMYILHTKISSRYHSVLMTIFCGWPVAILFKKPLHELLGRSKCRCPFVLLNFELCDMVADEVVETPYIVCKTIVLTVELIGKICSSIGCRHFGFNRLRRIPASRHSNGQLLGLTMSGMEIVKMHAINAIYWIRTNVSSIAASALTTKLNAQMVDTNVTLLYASLKSTRSKWPNHYDSLLYQLSYVLTFWRGRLDSNQRPTAWNAKWTLRYGS